VTPEANESPTSSSDPTAASSSNPTDVTPEGPATPASSSNQNAVSPEANESPVIPKANSSPAAVIPKAYATQASSLNPTDVTPDVNATQASSSDPTTVIPEVNASPASSLNPTAVTPDAHATPASSSNPTDVTPEAPATPVSLSNPTVVTPEAYATSASSSNPTDVTGKSVKVNVKKKVGRKSKYTAWWPEILAMQKKGLVKLQCLEKFNKITKEPYPEGVYMQCMKCCEAPGGSDGYINLRTPYSRPYWEQHAKSVTHINVIALNEHKENRIKKGQEKRSIQAGIHGFFEVKKKTVNSEEYEAELVSTEDNHVIDVDDECTRGNKL